MTMIRICAVVLVFGATACTKNSTTPTTTPVTATRTTDTFSGTVQVGGRDFRGFTVSQTGQVDVTLTAAGPPSTIVRGLAVGMPGDATCAPLAGASTSAQTVDDRATFGHDQRGNTLRPGLRHRQPDRSGQLHRHRHASVRQGRGLGD